MSGLTGEGRKKGVDKIQRKAESLEKQGVLDRDKKK